MKRLNIYVCHATNFDYENELYMPLKASRLNQEHQLILPHGARAEFKNSKTIIQQADLVLAEVSYPSTGQGIELRWANVFSVPVLCLNKQDQKYSSSLSIISKQFFSYASSQELIANLTIYLQNF